MSDMAVPGARLSMLNSEKFSLISGIEGVAVVLEVSRDAKSQFTPCLMQLLHCGFPSSHYSIFQIELYLTIKKNEPLGAGEATYLHFTCFA